MHGRLRSLPVCPGTGSRECFSHARAARRLQSSGTFGRWPSRRPNDIVVLQRGRSVPIDVSGALPADCRAAAGTFALSIRDVRSIHWTRGKKSKSGSGDNTGQPGIGSGGQGYKAPSTPACTVARLFVAFNSVLVDVKHG